MWFWGQLVYVVLTIAILRLVYGKHGSLSTSLLSGLNAYELDDTSNHRGRLNRHTRRAIKLGASNQLQQIELQKTSIQQTVFYHHFDALVCLTALTTAHGVAYFLAPYLLRNRSLVCIPLTILTGVGSVLVLIKVDMMSIYTARFEKWFNLGIFIFCFTFCLSLLSLVPDHIFTFNLEDISEELSQQILALLTKVASDAKIEMNTEVHIKMPLVAIALSLVASLIGSGMSQAAIRATRSMQIQLNPPHQLERYSSLDNLRCFIKQIQDVILFINCSLPFTPLAEQFSLTSSTSLIRLQSYGLLFWSICQVLLIRVIVQGYLNGGLIYWFDFIQGRKKTQLSEHEAKIEALKIHKFSLFLCKVAVQALVPSMCLGSCGLLILIGIESKNKLMEQLFSFIGWWTSLCWLIYTLIIIGMLRTSLLT
eukprot:g8892.t1